MKQRIAHFRREYLPWPPSETFIHNQIIRLKKHKPIVFAREFLNEDVFPLPPGIRKYSFKNSKFEYRNSKQVEKCKIQNIQRLNKKFKLKISNFSYKYFRHATNFELKSYARFLKKQNVKLIHAYFGTDGRYIMKLKKMLRIPFVVSFHGYDISRFPNDYFGYGKIYLRKLFREADLVLARSQDMKKDLIRYHCPEKKIMIHTTGIDPKKFLYVDRSRRKNDSIQLLFIGRFCPYKGIDDLISAFAKALRQNSNLFLHLGGDGEVRKEIEEKVKLLGIYGQVQFHGFVDYRKDIFDLYRKADIFIHPSKMVKSSKYEKEGIPNTIMEAMASGLPVISTYHAGIPELVKNQKSGFLVPEGDVSALSEKILQFADDPKMRISFGKFGRKIIEEDCNIEKQVEKLEEIYEKVIFHN